MKRKLRCRLATILTYLAMAALALAEKNNAAIVETHFWRPAMKEYCQPRVDECHRANKKMSRLLTQIGDLANEAVLNPNRGDDRRALEMILEVVRSFE